MTNSPRLIWIGISALLFGIAACALPQDPPSGPSPPGMVWIPGGSFQMGSESGRMDEMPVHEVEIDGFWMDSTEVTNAQFAQFVDDTGYVTVAERPLDPSEFPGVDPAMLAPGSLLFQAPDRPVSLRDFTRWWIWQPGASWRTPEGPGSNLDGRDDHPVVHVCWEDAVAYAAWRGGRLPTEAEWERAARAGVEGQRFVWGDDPPVDETPRANIWTGQFPTLNTAADGFEITGPVGSYPANGYGLYDMAGNVWEWVSDWYRPDYYQKAPKRSPLGPDQSFDPQEPGVPKRVVRGGSFLCHDTYCESYRPSARMKNDPRSATNHTGFRIVMDVD